MSITHDTNRDENVDWKATYKSYYDQGKAESKTMTEVELKACIKHLRNSGHIMLLAWADGAEGKPFQLRGL
jgi:hypothetical protein